MIDPRAHSTTKLTTVAPLPLISRSALKRIKHPAAIPTTCPLCSGGVALVSNKTIYGREYGDWPYAYKCVEDCDAYVGLHPGTDIPLGTIADRALRTERNNNKKFFERIWREDLMDRNEAYAWLADQLCIDLSECHFGLFDAARCRMAGAVCRAYLVSSYA